MKCFGKFCGGNIEGGSDTVVSEFVGFVDKIYIWEVFGIIFKLVIF